MTDASAIALIGIVPATVIALATLITSIRNGRKADIQAVKTQQIHVQTNGHLSKVTKELATAKREILALKNAVIKNPVKGSTPKKKR